MRRFALPLLALTAVGCYEPLPGPHILTLASEEWRCDEIDKREVHKLDFSGKAGTKLNGEILGYLNDAALLMEARTRLGEDLADACAQLGADLGLPEVVAKPPDGIHTVENIEKMCAAVTDKLTSLVNAGQERPIVGQLAPSCPLDLTAAPACLSACGSALSAKEMASACEERPASPRCSPGCEMSCAARAALATKCQAAAWQTAPAAAETQETAMLARALQNSLPEIVRIELGTGPRISAASQWMGQVGVVLKDNSIKAGARALVCVARALKETAISAANSESLMRAAARIHAAAGGTPTLQRATP